MDAPTRQAETAIQELREIAEKGLPECYGGQYGEDWQGDFWSHLGSDEAIRKLRTDPRLPAIAAAILARDGFDVIRELTSE